MEQKNPFQNCLSSLQDGEFEFFSLKKLSEQYKDIDRLPVSVKILLECAIRNCDGFAIKKEDVEKIVNWRETSEQDVEIPFKPARVILQDFTGVPAVVDLAGMRDAVKRLGSDPQKINPLCPVDLVIDHSVQADSSRNPQAKDQNESIEFQRNYQRFEFLKWGQSAFDNFLIVPPGSGIVHQVNLEYLARVVFQKKEKGGKTLVYPDSVVGTDSHTTMINGLGVMGWGVGGIEAEAVMMGQNISMVLPQVVGFQLTGHLSQLATATDLVLTCVQMLRKRGVVGKFVEFFGEGVFNLSLADRATVSNMAPEYGATMGFFPIDERTLDYLRLTNRDEHTINMIKEYLVAQGLFITPDSPAPVFSGEVMHLDLSTVQPCLSGPKRPHDMVLFKNMQTDFQACMHNPNGFKGFGVDQTKLDQSVNLNFQGHDYQLKHGAVVIAAITSCTNTSNPDVILAAGLLAKNAVDKGLKVNPYIKTTLSPGSGVVEQYIRDAGLEQSFNALGFYLAGFGCMTCIGNSGELDPEVHKLIVDNDLTVTSVLSGNRNFEARVHPLTKGNYLASPPLVVAYALAGTVDIDFDTTPLGYDPQGQPVYLHHIWPSRDTITACSAQYVNTLQFKNNYDKISKGTDRWNALEVQKTLLYNWKEESTYIHNPPFFQNMEKTLPKIEDIVDAYCLANFGDSITTDHISPAGNIAITSAAAQFLQARGVDKLDFNTYGARRGNDQIMARGTFANTRIINKLMQGKVGPTTLYIPNKEPMSFYEASEKYKEKEQGTIILAGKEYGSGSSRDWAAKGPYLLGVKCVIAQSYERIHRSNLVGMGILPCEFNPGESADSLALTGHEQFSIPLQQGNLHVNQQINVTCSNGLTFKVKCRLDTDVEVEYFKNGGILHYVLRNLINQ